MGTPGGVTVACAVAQRDAATVEDDGDIERTLALGESLRWYDRRTEVETCDTRGQTIFRNSFTVVSTVHIILLQSRYTHNATTGKLTHI